VCVCVCVCVCPVVPTLGLALTPTQNLGPDVCASSDVRGRAHAAPEVVTQVGVKPDNSILGKLKCAPLHATRKTRVSYSRRKGCES
jgi:hypothetical protein